MCTPTVSEADSVFPMNQTRSPVVYWNIGIRGLSCKGEAMNKICLLVVVLVTCLAEASAQQDRKFELGAMYSVQDTAGRSTAVPSETGQGFGGRVTYNFTDHFSVEGETNYLPSDPTSINVFGPKVGLRRGRMGFFGKVRPGLLWMRDRNRCPVSAPCVAPDSPLLNKTTSFAMDLGAVIEFYHSPRLFFRMDLSDIMAAFDHTRMSEADGFQLPYPYRLVHHNAQLGLGVSFRF